MKKKHYLILIKDHSNKVSLRRSSEPHKWLAILPEEEVCVVIC